MEKKEERRKKKENLSEPRAAVWITTAFDLHPVPRIQAS